MHSIKGRKKLNRGILLIIVKKIKDYQWIIKTINKGTKTSITLAIRRVQIKHRKRI